MTSSPRSIARAAVWTDSACQIVRRVARVPRRSAPIARSRAQARARASSAWFDTDVKLEVGGLLAERRITELLGVPDELLGDRRS